MRKNCGRIANTRTIRFLNDVRSHCAAQKCTEDFGPHNSRRGKLQRFNSPTGRSILPWLEVAVFVTECPPACAATTSDGKSRSPVVATVWRGASHRPQRDGSGQVTCSGCINTLCSAESRSWETWRAPGCGRHGSSPNPALIWAPNVSQLT